MWWSAATVRSDYPLHDKREFPNSSGSDNTFRFERAHWTDHELRAKAFNNGSAPSLVKSALYEVTTDPNNHTPPVITLIRPAGAVIVP